jgi:type IV pilus assembly protein PilX
LGFALITALLFLIILSVLAVTMFGSSTMQGKISGSTLERQRAMQAAEYALRNGEWWLKTGGMLETTCTQMVDLSVPTNQPMICLNDLTSPTSLPWSAGISLTPRGMTVQANGGTVATTSSTTPDVNYARQPSLYIFKLGADTSGNMLYRLTAAGYGGLLSSASVLQAVVSLQ